MLMASTNTQMAFKVCERGFLPSMCLISPHMTVRWGILSYLVLPLRVRWSTSESCSLRPVWLWARCRSVSSGRPGGCCWCTFSPHCWECLGSKGNLSRYKQMHARYQMAANKICDLGCATGVFTQIQYTPAINKNCMLYPCFGSKQFHENDL